MRANQNSSVKKRFIAGATCKQCGAIDTTVIYLNSEQDSLECVACGYREQRPESETPTNSNQNDTADITPATFKPR